MSGRDAFGRDDERDEEFDGNEREGGAVDSSEMTPEELIALLGGSPFDPTLDPELAELDELDDDDLSEFGGAAPDEALSERELAERRRALDTDWAAEAERVYDELLERVGEAQPEPRLEATRRACELLGDVHDGWSMVHITGTNGKSSTARITESLVRAHGLRTGLLTSPHLVRVNERICLDGEPISDERLVTVWRDIEPILGLVDAELEAAGDPPLTFFEALTALAYAAFTDATIDIGIVEVGMGGEWDSTNIADGDVAVFAPIALDHQGRLGSTLAEIARTKAGIIKPGAEVVTAEQAPEVLDELRRACEIQAAELFTEPTDFGVASDQLAVGGRLVEVRGLRGTYPPSAVRLSGDYQAHNVALAVAAVETLLGERLNDEALAAGLLDAKSPGRLDLIGTEPSVLIDAAHNPHGAEHLAVALRESFAFDDLVLVLGVLREKNVEGIIKPLAEIASRIIITESDSPRAIPAWELAELVRDAIGDEAAEAKRVEVVERSYDAFDLARREAVELGMRGSAGVLITGSITLIGEAAGIAEEDGWRTGGGDSPLSIGAGPEGSQ
ncbi:bifunctional folylpolyglutamate synthase/dihydrofolate synthase [Gulosibacter macacae]|nr:folylpolyglutamate synthase/dihydrofolate synthase family protein [Gulosibacter macacae]